MAAPPAVVPLVMSRQSIAAVVPAKGSSVRVSGKNRQLMLGVPLFLWAANNLRRVLPADCIYIDSDCEQTRALAEAAGFRSITRPAHLATNATCGNGLMRFAASQLEADILVQHMPPMPFLREETLRQIIDAVAEGGESSFGALVEPLYLWNESGPTYNRAHIPNSVDLTPTIVEGMGIYAAQRSRVLETGLRLPGTPILIELDRFESVDIDTAHDLEFARSLARGCDPGSPYVRGMSELALSLAQAA